MAATAWAPVILPQAAAQDVLIAPLMWCEPNDAPDQLPTFRKVPYVTFPAEVRATDEIGYAIFEIFLDKNGRTLSLRPFYTLQIYGSAAFPQDSERDPLWKPARRAGKGVEAAVSYAVIFNPVSAAENRPDATPRLLTVSLVRRAVPATSRPMQNPEQIVSAKVTVDEQGRVVAVSDAPAELARDLNTAAKTWKFAPARKAGKAIGSEVRVPFVIVTVAAEEANQRFVPPRAVSQRIPEYPYEMRRSGIRGSVLLSVRIDDQGRVSDVFVASSLNPAFDDAALAAARDWRFEPAKRNGRAVECNMQSPIYFSIDNALAGGRGPLVTTQKPDFSKLPEEFHYDVPPVPIGTARPIYPYDMLRAKKEGHAIVRYVVGRSGDTEFVQVVQASAPEFGGALVAAVERFYFQPAFKASHPTLALESYEENFNFNEATGLVQKQDLVLAKREAKDPKSIVAADELDGPLKLISRPPLKFPVSIKGNVTSGRALVEFLVDEQGRVRLPRLVDATDEAFGFAAIQSVASWRFDPPKRGGHITVARVRWPVEFLRPASNPAAEKR